MIHLLRIDIKETTRKAIPAHDRLPVRSQTTKPIMAPGSMNRSTLAIRTIITMPTKTSKNKKSNSYSIGKLGKSMKGKNSPKHA